jgi:DNA-binding IclR family transcriptional regulator
MPDADKLAEKHRLPDPPQRYIVPGLERGLKILRKFNRVRTEISAPIIAKELGIPRSTVFRLMQTLEHMGFIEKVKNSGDYRLGVGVLSLGFEFLASLEITELARPVLEKLRDDTGFSSHLVIRDGCDVVFIIKASAKGTFSSAINIGTRLPAHGTVLGRVLLADLTDEELNALYLSETLPKFSHQTPQTLGRLKEILEQDRKLGYAISEAYFESGIGAIAAQVRDASKRVVAAINVTYQNSNVEAIDIQGEILAKVLQAANEISHQMNYNGISEPIYSAGNY